MKKTLQILSVSLLLLLAVLGTAACGVQPETPDPGADSSVGSQVTEDAGIWADALYTADTTLGEGATTITVVVKAEDKSITFTVNTDKTTVGDALLEHNLIEGEEGAYGLYVKKVNGIVADYDVDQTYWGFYIDGEYAMTGVDSTDITAGATYTLERTK